MEKQQLTQILTAQEAGLALRSGQVVAIPTETVYGLGADATNEDAVQKIFELKQRPGNNPLIVHIDAVSKAQLYVQWDERAQRLADEYWPGPLTLVLPIREHSPISKYVTAGLSTLAIRVPSHEVALEILRAADIPIAAPSANISGKLSPTEPQHVIQNFGALVPLVDGGATTVGLESTIVDLTTAIPTLLRPGGILKESIEQLMELADLPAAQAHSNSPKSPGLFGQHYAPKSPIRLDATEVASDEALLAFGPTELLKAAKICNLSPDGSFEEAAANLYSMLHILDQPQYRCIAVTHIPETGLGRAIMDRLRRAALSP